MTDNEIIKALETCNSPYSDYKCVSCPLYDTESNCKTALTVVALDLINRQKAEIERLTEEINALNGNTEKYIAECEKRSREIAKDYRKEIKSEAIREFAEKVKSNCEWFFGYNISRNKLIDGLAKEMTEESNDQQKT